MQSLEGSLRNLTLTILMAGLALPTPAAAARPSRLAAQGAVLLKFNPVFPAPAFPLISGILMALSLLNR